MARAAGALRERVTIQQPTEVADSQGGAALTWSTLATVWAAVRPWVRGGAEYAQAAAVGAHADYEVEINYRTDVTPAMRLSWTPYAGSAKTLQILEVVAPDRMRLLLQCSEVI